MQLAELHRLCGPGTGPSANPTTNAHDATKREFRYTTLLPRRHQTVERQLTTLGFSRLLTDASTPKCSR